MINYKKYLLVLAWVVALAATIGSLYFSEVMGLAPCVLCWYQRIFMYPLVWLLGWAVVKKDKAAVVCAVPLAIMGGLVALYHNWYYYTFKPIDLLHCGLVTSCTVRYFSWWVVIDIPQLSLLAFAVIVISLWWYNKLSN